MQIRPAEKSGCLLRLMDILINNRMSFQFDLSVIYFFENNYSETKISECFYCKRITTVLQPVY